MSDSISRAFDHPLARSVALSGEVPLDRISLRDHVREVEIGAFQAERGTTQRLRFNVVVEVVALDEPVDDDVDRILSYDRVTEAIGAELAAERLNLLETLAERVALRILHEPQAMRVFVRIEKLDRGPGALGVEIVRARDDAPAAAEETAGAAPHPVVVYLAPGAMSAPDLPRWLDRLSAGPAPAILCVGPGEGARPASASALAQRRIDLLSIEQNAWVLAGRDRRCVVVATRTELDWAMKQGQLSVWAPSKIVLDAHAGPEADPRDGPGLAAWLAVRLDAHELIVIGAGAPLASIPVRTVTVEVGP